MVKAKIKMIQTGYSNPYWDERYSAKFPGRRVSKNGNVYYEYRMNRSDLSKKKPWK